MQLTQSELEAVLYAVGEYRQRHLEQTARDMLRHALPQMLRNSIEPVQLMAEVDAWCSGGMVWS